MHGFLDQDTQFLSASDNGREQGNDEVEWRNISIQGNDCETLTLRVRVDDNAQNGDSVRLRVRAGDDEDSESTLIEERRRIIRDPIIRDPILPPTVPPVVPIDPIVPVGPETGVVTVDKQSDRREAQPGSILGYTIRVRNEGGGVAQNITVEDQFTAGALTVEEAGGGFPRGNGITWEIPQLGPGETRILRYRVRISDAMRHGQSIVNNVRVSGVSFDRTAHDSTQVSVIQHLPQTGTFVASTNNPTQNLRSLRPGGSAPTNELPFVMWTTIITMGMSLGSVFGKKVFL